MALDIDLTGNEGMATTLEKMRDAIDANLSGANPSVTTLTTSGLATVGSAKIGTGTKTATATAGAATLAKPAGKITTEALSTAAAATYTLTITATGMVAAADQVFVSIANGTNSAGAPTVLTVVPASNTITVVIRNSHATDALNGTLVVSYMVLKN